MKRNPRYILAAFIVVLTCFFALGLPTAGKAAAQDFSLSLDGGVYAYAESTGTKTVRLRPEQTVTIDADGNFLIRIKISFREINKANDKNAVVSFRILTATDTLRVESGEFSFGFISADGSVSEVLSSEGSNGAVFSLPAGTDGTLVLPIGRFYAVRGNDRISAKDALSADNAITLIEVDFSASRWDIFVGQAAFSDKNESVATFSAEYSSPSRNLRLLRSFTDKVALFVNGKEASVSGEELFAVIEGVGEVSVRGELAFFDKLGISSRLSEGYGITRIRTEVEGIENYGKDHRKQGYVFEENLVIRTNRDENTAVLGFGEIKINLFVTVEKLVRLEVTSAGVTINYGEIDDSEDGVLFLAKNYPAVLTAVVTGGFDFSGLYYNGKRLENVASAGEDFRCVLTPDEDGFIDVIGFAGTVTLTVDAADEVSISEGGKEMLGEYEFQRYTRLILTLTAAEGYDGIPVLTGENGKLLDVGRRASGEYVIVLTENMTLSAYASVRTFAISYDLSGGSYESGSNPSFITYFDEAELISPVKKGYTFLGWRIVGSEDYVSKLSGVKNDLYLVAVFEKNPDNPDNPDDPNNPDDNQGCGGCGGCNGCGSCGSCGNELSGATILPSVAAVLLLVAPSRRKKDDSDDKSE